MSYHSRSAFSSTFAPPFSQAPPTDRASLLDQRSTFGVSQPESWSSRRPYLSQSFSAPVISGAGDSFRTGLRSDYIAPLPESALERLSSSAQSWSGDWSCRLPAHRSLLDERSPLPGITGDTAASAGSRYRHETRRERIIPIEREKIVLPSISGSTEVLEERNGVDLTMTMNRRSLNGQAANGRVKYSTLDENRGSVRSGAGSVGGNRHNQGLTGLRNIGNTCYMNAVLQCLSCTRPLLELVLEERLSADISTSGNSRGALIRAFTSLIHDMWSPSSSRNRVADTEHLKDQLDKFAPRFTGHDQQDAQEFLRYILEGLHQEINKARTRSKSRQTSIDENLSNDQIALESWRRQLLVDNSILVGMFMGQLQSTLTCGSCQHSSVTFDAFWDISLPIPSSGPSRMSGYQEIDLDDCLAAFTGEEVLDSVERPFCSKCRRRQTSSKSLRLHRLPPVLVLHLKRFGSDTHIGQHSRMKISTTIHFPLSNLSLEGFCTSSSTQRYDLHAVVNHQGSQNSGHYTAHCRHPYSDQWHLFDDTSVRAVDSPSSVVSSRAYILFYEKVADTTSHL